MYETEANIAIENSSQVPLEVTRSFEELRGRIVSRTVLPWSEHCTECVWPTCYSTCDLYSPRQDGRCRRFADGMVRVELPSAVNSYLLKIRFKRWGKVWSPGNVRLHSAEKAQTLERRDYRIGTVLYQLLFPSGIKKAATGKRYSFKKTMAARESGGHELPTSFLVECYNPEPRNVQLSLTMRPGNERSKMPFQRLIELPQGFHRIRIPMDEITALLDVQAPFDIELTPRDDEKETTLYFGLMEFVKEVAQPAEKTAKIKCVVWDLDNTLWDGVLMEDGPEQLRLKPGIIDVIQTLDSRGILHSIASRNNKEDAVQILKKFQLDTYFLCPQISWQPKSDAITAIVRQLNIGINSLLFVDDSEFELEQVKIACPQVQVLNAKDYRTIPEMKECQVPVTAESKDRRKLYQIAANRQKVAQSFGKDYMAFLEHCQIELTIQPMTGKNLERVHELTQRTNRMNFSGNRYDRDVLRKILSTPHLDTFVMSCEDRFGSYGVIGFSIVDNLEPRMTDLMFSCRIQCKRIEHAFLAYVIPRYLAKSGRDFLANYRKTLGNEPSGRVFADLGMEEIEAKDGVSLLVFRKGREVPNDGVIRFTVQKDSSLNNPNVRQQLGVTTDQSANDRLTQQQRHSAV
jgi:FkbH-like protein